MNMCVRLCMRDLMIAHSCISCTSVYVCRHALTNMYALTLACLRMCLYAYVCAGMYSCMDTCMYGRKRLRWFTCSVRTLIWRRQMIMQSKTTCDLFFVERMLFGHGPCCGAEGMLRLLSRWKTDYFAGFKFLEDFPMQSYA